VEEGRGEERRET
jgi:hypothetical protein